MSVDKVGRVLAVLAVSTVWSAAFIFASAPVTAQTAGGSSSVGVVVDPVPTTLPPPTTEPPPPPTTEAPPAPPPTAAPQTPTTQPAVKDEQSESTTTTTEPPEIRPSDPDAPRDSDDTLVVKAVKGTTKFVRDIASGKAVADAVQEALPEPVAAVVVPAVRTASTFAFPIGLAGAVFAFLILQQRIDSSDPKLSAAPIAHDDDVIEFK